MYDYNLSQDGLCTQHLYGPDYDVIFYLTRISESVSLGQSSQNGDRKRANPQKLDKRKVSYLKGKIHLGYESSPYYEDLDGCQGLNPDPGGQTVLYSDVAYNKALEKFYTKLRGELDLSIDLLEARQVRSMMQQGLSSLRHMVTTVRQMRRAPARTAANMWLQWTYGWKPLASSIYNTMMLFANGANSGIIHIRTTGSEVDRRDVSWNATGDAVPSRTIESTSSRCMIQGTFGITDSSLNNLASMTSLNPASIAWELFPYSFVFDWFYDIGGYLKNLESALLYDSEFKFGHFTEGYKLEGWTTVVGSYQDLGLDRSYDLVGSYVWTGKRRSVLYSSPLPRAPSFKVDLGINRLLSAASLLQQQLGKRR